MVGLICWSAYAWEVKYVCKRDGVIREWVEIHRTLGHFELTEKKQGNMFLRWLVVLKLIQLEQQKTQLPLIILAKNLKPILCRVIKGT